MKLSKYSPQIFIAAGIAGYVGAIIFSVKKADKVKPIVKKAKEDLKETSKKGSKTKAQVITKAVVDISKEMSIPIGMATLATGCILKSYNIMSAENLAAVGTIDILKRNMNAYKKSVIEEVGEDAAEKIENRVVKNQIIKQLEQIRANSPTNSYDLETFNRYFSTETSNKFPTGGADTVLPFLKSQETYFNQLLHSRERFGRPGIVRFNEVLDALGFQKIPEGETAGWVSYGGKGFIDFGISGAYYADFDDVLDRYNCVADPGTIPRSESGYMLCFNVDPFIWK